MTFKEVYISIHALLTESDSIAWSPFLAIRISIHALLTESDGQLMDSLKVTGNFNPRSPHGERHMTNYMKQFHIKFQSTLSSRRATCHINLDAPFSTISIHALLTESDVLW